MGVFPPPSALCRLISPEFSRPELPREKPGRSSVPRALIFPPFIGMVARSRPRGWLEASRLDVQ
jgi:hypothetical protein